MDNVAAFIAVAILLFLGLCKLNAWYDNWLVEREAKKALELWEQEQDLFQRNMQNLWQKPEEKDGTPKTDN